MTVIPQKTLHCMLFVITTIHISEQGCVHGGVWGGPPKSATLQNLVLDRFLTCQSEARDETGQSLGKQT